MTYDVAAAAAHEPSLPTPPEVIEALRLAFGREKVGETGYEIDAAKCTSEQEKAAARIRGSSLLYGEMLPDGVSKILSRDRLGAALQGPDAFVLELGMGSGKVAMQMFLQCPAVKTVLGVELVNSRYAIGEAALHRLAESLPDYFRVCAYTEGELACLEDRGGRKLQFQCADFFSLGLDLVQQSDAIVFAVNIPCKLFPDLCRRFAQAKEGCRLYTYHPLNDIWWVDDSCPFHQCEANILEADTFSTSWSPQGYRFYCYVCDRSRPATVGTDPRNETYSQWSAVWDQQSSAHYYHNQESEVSQWEIPREVGGWQVGWSEDHSAYYFWHGPTNHAQWEAPKCMADLGWSTNAWDETPAAGGSAAASGGDDSAWGQ